ncbi:histidine kinase [Corynebacterium mastitidis]|uniref:histidine kinase n=1 Tax=Corynebacterium mastitidis TaxID=161890 RepID=A0A2N0X9X4_9CORY|nr:histidine kinase [Corynebacterium mastitidis]MCH6197749.1 histidine kinase [Corynebacterium mastitidis]PKF69510.1 hypothetical protein CXB45_01230 [Corynebacterium mastitidis]
MPAVSRFYLRLLFGLALVLYILAFLGSPRAPLGAALGLCLCALWALWSRGVAPRRTGLAFSLTALACYLTANWVSSSLVLFLAILVLVLSIHRAAGLAFLALVTALTGGIHLQAGDPTRALTESLTIGALLGVGYAFAAQIQQLQRQSAIERDLLLSRERERTARSLHDGLGHRLTAIILGIDAALRLPAEEAHRELTRARGTAREALDEMRATVRAMTPLELRDGDLLRALNSVAESFSSTALRVRVVGGGQPPEPLALLALRFTQEALTNVVRHSDAGAVLIEVEASQEGLRIRAEDDGSPADFSPGYGISSLDRRARELGGRVTASAEKGFSLLMEVPCASS